MKQYNHALDYTLLALNELTKPGGKPALAARLLASAAKQPDVMSAISILEASNKQAFEISAAARLKAKRTVKAEVEEEMIESDDAEDTCATAEDMITSDDDMCEDPLDEVEVDEEVEDTEPGAAMARVLSKMVRKSGRR